MKRASVLAVLLLVLGTRVQSATAERIDYTEGHLGLAFVSDSHITDQAGVTGRMSFDPGLAFGFTRGRDYGFVRYEGEIGYFRVATDDLEAFNVSVPIDADNSAFFFLLNGWFQREDRDAPTSPYGGIGLGFARAAVSDASAGGRQVWESDSDYVLALQLGAGARFRVTDRVSLDVRYRYFATTDPEFESADAELHAHMLVIGGAWVDE